MSLAGRGPPAGSSARPGRESAGARRCLASLAEAEQTLRPFLLEVQRAGWRRLDATDAPAQLGYIGADARVGQYADAEGQRRRANVVSPLQRQAQRHCGDVRVSELAM